METYKAHTYWVKIYIAGPVHEIEQVCREFVLTGLCVSIKENKYIYTYGEEIGTEIELIRYPKYPKDESEILELAKELANKIMNKIKCGSFTLMDSNEAITYDRRK